MDISRIHAMKESLTEWAKSEIEKGKECVDTEEMGSVIDMIKDLADAEKNCYEAKYYKAIHEAMEKEDKEHNIPWYLGFFGGMDARAGYDNWRYSSGRFAPKGHGHMERDGYTRPYTLEDHRNYRDTHMGDSDWTNPWMENSRMGFNDQNGMMNNTHYDRYKDARRHYTETHSMKDKSAMDTYAQAHVDGAIESFRDIWQDADPDMRRRMKSNLSTLINEMTI